MRQVNGKRDKLEPVIIAELRARGALVVQLDRPVDLLVGYAGAWSLAEVKSGRSAPMRPSQLTMFAQAQAAGCPIYLIDDLDDVETHYPIGLALLSAPLQYASKPAESEPLDSVETGNLGG